MKVPRNLLLLFLLGLGGLAVPASAGIIYQQTFGNTTSSNVSLSAAGVDWQAFDRATGADLTANATPLTSGPSISGGSGFPSNAANVNSQGTSGLANGFGLLAGGTGNPGALYYTSFYPVDFSSYSDITFDWYQADSSAAATLQVAVEVGGQWYVTSQTFTTAAVGFDQLGNNPRSFAFTLDASAWKTLSFTEGSPITVGATPGSNLSGAGITAFGVFVQSAGSNSRFDTFSVSAQAVPEAGSATLCLAALGLALWKAPRRRGMR